MRLYSTKNPRSGLGIIGLGGVQKLPNLLILVVEGGKFRQNLEKGYQL